MRKYNKLRNEKDQIINGIKKDTQELEKLSSEAERIADVSKNVHFILSDLDRQFESATKLNGMDIAFVFFATALQCIRQYVLTPFKERTTDKESAVEAHKQEEEIFKRRHGDGLEKEGYKRYYASIGDMVLKGVPYDVQFGSSNFSLGLSGNAHRFRTLGHDPLLGWVFGTANIMTNTLTTWNFQTYHIKSAPMANGSEKAKIVRHADTVKMIDKTINRSIKEPEALATALIKQRLHIKSDEFSIAGLPIPGLTALSPDIAQKLAEMNIDYGNAVTVGKQALYSVFINTVIGMIHGMFYDENEGARSLYEVRTRKVLSYSNALASASNVIAVAMAGAIATATSNPELGKKAGRYLDVGGIAVTLYRLVNDKKFIQKIKREFLEKEFYNIVMGEMPEK